jgi:hypothetical protein
MKIIMAIWTMFLTVYSVNGQSKSEVGIMGGVSYYLGDLNINKHFHLSQPAAGIVCRYIFNPHFALKNSFYYGKVEGNDALSNNPVHQSRNLHFRSTVIDIATEIEFNFFPFDEGKSERMIRREGKYYFSPYVFVGISMFSFNPQARHDDTWFELQPLGTEGQGTIAYPDKKKYSLTQLCIPFGTGIKYDLTNKINMAFEWGLRYTFTDYIDDVSTTYANPMAIAAEKGPVARDLSDPSANKESINENTGRQRGNSKNNDLYVFTGVMITFKIINKYQQKKCIQQ